MPGFRVALLYNLKRNVPLEPGGPPDALAEYDSMETVQALKEALQAGGYQVIPLEGDETLLDTIRQADPDIAFNICEGHRGDARESQVPALLEMLGLPYTGSKILAHALSLDKATAKRIWRDCGLPTASFQVFAQGDEPLDPWLEFPLFVKPCREGSGMGINARSIVEDETALREQVRWLIRTYHQPALVEGYLPGREFTVGLLGNIPSPGSIPSGRRETGFHIFPVLEVDVTPVAEAGGLYTSHVKMDLPLAPNYLCPAPIEPALAEELSRLAVAAFESIGALDVARVDFRLGADGRPYLMEINTLPGLNPTYSDLVIMARAEGMDYVTLINEILNLALDRYGLVWDLGVFSRLRSRI
jgi:D-alanine-D-alanine ligase